MLLCRSAGERCTEYEEYGYKCSKERKQLAIYNNNPKYTAIYNRYRKLPLWIPADQYDLGFAEGGRPVYSVPNEAERWILSQHRSPLDPGQLRRNGPHVSELNREELAYRGYQPRPKTPPSPDRMSLTPSPPNTPSSPRSPPSPPRPKAPPSPKEKEFERLKEPPPNNMAVPPPPPPPAHQRPHEPIWNNMAVPPPPRSPQDPPPSTMAVPPPPPRPRDLASLQGHITKRRSLTKRPLNEMRGASKQCVGLLIITSNRSTH
jgi:hypothetical protein